MVKAGDSEFEAAFDELFPVAQRIARRITGSPAVAEEIAAEALARAYARWRKVRRLLHRDAWVLRVATNLAIDTVRRRAPSLQAEAAEIGPEDAVAVRLALTAALTELPRRQREAVALRYLSGLSETEVAAALGISAGSVKTHVHRGLETLRRRLGTTFEEVFVGPSR